MTRFDFTPLFRSSVGFDRLTRMLDAATRQEDGSYSYPPYNIETTGENAYRITMAVAGFGESDIGITAQENSLVITGKLAKTDDDRKFLHRGIAGRAFERRFELADHIKVAGASLVNGLLHVDLAREVPEAMKPRSIKIETKAATKPTVIEGKAA
jgi:molecular chaperone IbpA